MPYMNEDTYQVGFHHPNGFCAVETFIHLRNARKYVETHNSDVKNTRKYTIQQYSNGRWVDLIEEPTNTQSTQKSRYDRTFSYIVSTLLNNSYRVSESMKYGRIDYLKGDERGRIQVYESGEVSGVIPGCLFDKLIGSDLAY